MIVARPLVHSTRAPQNSLNLHSLPPATSRCRDAALVQRLRDPSSTGDALSPDSVDHREQVGGSCCGLLPSNGSPSLTPEFGVFEVLHAATQLDPPRLGRGERRLRPLGDCAPLFLRDHRHDADRQTVSVWHVRRSESYPRTLEPEEEVRIAGEAIELGDDQRRFSNPAFREGSRELRAIVPLAALDLDELRQRGRPEPVR
jgi:hypothetical protein